MIGKQGLLDLVARAERGALLDGEAAILRDAIELLDDLATVVDKIVRNAAEIRELETIQAAMLYERDTTQSLRVIRP